MKGENFEEASDLSAMFIYETGFFCNCRFLLSLTSNSRCLVVDDQLNVLPITSKVLKVEPVDKQSIQSENEEQLNELKESLRDTQPVCSLVNCCKTLDQVNELLISLWVKLY